ncbi:MAG TPA: hypothetical protein VFA04_27825 [Bryobacteraceae bacterium]|nr:hypothetical protein [Bryobacteraceae bacterium]
MGSGLRRWACAFGALAFAFVPASPQVIEFDSGGLHYKTLTKNGFTVMFAVLPAHVRHWAVLQVSVANGSSLPWVIKPEDFSYQKEDGEVVQASDAGDVVDSLLAKAGRGDVIRLVTTYEAGIYGNSRLRSTNGYEARRRDALAEVSSAKLKAAAAASAIVLVNTRLSPGESTDGAVFLASAGKTLGPGKLVVHAAAETFEFDSDGLPVSSR